MRFVDDPRAPLDNNHVERAIRPVALGRKNHLGSKSPRGVETTAILYTVIETAKLAGIDPRAYMLAAVRASLAKCPGFEPAAVPGPDGPATSHRLWPHQHGTDAMFFAGFRRLR